MEILFKKRVRQLVFLLGFLLPVMSAGQTVHSKQAVHIKKHALHHSQRHSPHHSLLSVKKRSRTGYSYHPHHFHQPNHAKPILSSHTSNIKKTLIKHNNPSFHLHPVTINTNMDTIDTDDSSESLQEEVLPSPFKIKDAASIEDMPYPAANKKRLVTLVNKTMDSLQHTSYRYGGSYFDLSRGIYEEDCSGYVDQLLTRAEPNAFTMLKQAVHAEKPSSFDYFGFFKKLPRTAWHFWRKIEDVAELNPGSILVFRYHGQSHHPAGGHVMIVMSTPVPVANDANVFSVRVSDSASSGHSNDTRARHTSGVGIGTLLLRVNPFTHHPSAFAWNLNSFERSAEVAMAEPVNPV